MHETSRSAETEPGLPVPALTEETLSRAFEEAVARYIAEREAKIESFARRCYSLSGALELHGRAFGWDMLRAPLNIFMAGPYIAQRMAAGAGRGLGLKRTAARLEAVSPFLATDVAREIEWRVMTEFLELPYRQGERRYGGDALADALLADPRVGAALLPLLQAFGRRAEDPRFRAWLAEALTSYSGSRVAAADLANALIAAGVGALLLRQWTPGAISLGPALAQLLAQKLAVAAFPLGAGAGGLWYGLFPPAAPAALAASLTGGLMALAAVASAFTGILTDPLQYRLGLHQRRLKRLLAALERELLAEGEGRFSVKDHYVARVLDLLDVLAAAYRLAR